MGKVTIHKLEENNYEIILKDGNIHDRIKINNNEFIDLRQEIEAINEQTEQIKQINKELKEELKGWKI